MEKEFIMDEELYIGIRWFEMMDLFRDFGQWNYSEFFDDAHRKELFTKIDQLIHDTYYWVKMIKKREIVSFDIQSDSSMLYVIMQTATSIGCCIAYADGLRKQYSDFSAIFAVLLNIYSCISDVDFGNYENTAWDFNDLIEISSDYQDNFQEKELEILRKASYDWMNGGLEQICELFSSLAEEKDFIEDKNA